MEVDRPHMHEAHVGDVGMQFRQRRLGPRPLQRQKPAVERLDLADPAERGPQVREIVRLARGVDDQEQVVAAIGEHQVVEDAARIVGEEPVALPPLAEGEHVHRDQPFQRCGGIRQVPRPRPQRDLAHVADIEQPRGAARVQMLLPNPHRELQRHLVAGEGHHSRTKRPVHTVERRLLDLGHRAPSGWRWPDGLAFRSFASSSGVNFVRSIFRVGPSILPEWSNGIW